MAAVYLHTAIGEEVGALEGGRPGFEPLQLKYLLVEPADRVLARVATKELR